MVWGRVWWKIINLIFLLESAIFQPQWPLSTIWYIIYCSKIYGSYCHVTNLCVNCKFGYFTQYKIHIKHIISSFSSMTIYEWPIWRQWYIIWAYTIYMCYCYVRHLCVNCKKLKKMILLQIQNTPESNNLYFSFYISIWMTHIQLLI